MQGGEEEEKRSDASEATREGGSRESWYEEREGDRREEGSTRWEEGRKGSHCVPKCAIKGVCVNKQIDESKPIIKRGVTGAPSRCVHADKTAAVRAETEVLCFSLSGFYSSCSSNFRRGSLTSKVSA